MNDLIALDREAEELAHWQAWRYHHSTAPGQGATYTFNRECLLNFAKKLREREQVRCAKRLQRSRASLLLMAGEMTAQELRTVQAVLGGIRAEMEREALGAPLGRSVKPDRAESALTCSCSCNECKTKGCRALRDKRSKELGEIE